jgi:hypothetical protein
LNDPSEQWPFRFNITFSEDELRTYRKVMAARHAGGKNQGTVYGIMLAGISVFGLVVFGAVKLGWIESTAIRPVLFTAYFAFVAGAGSYYFAVRHYFRKFYRADASTGPWDFLFDNAGITYKSETTEVRLVWRALDSVDDLGPIVLFLFRGQGIGIPSRLFADDTARAGFVAAARARIKAAAESARP